MLKSERDLPEEKGLAAMVARLATTEDPSTESVWSFGFGSNMNVKLARSKKGLNVLEYTPGVVPGWRMSFRLKGFGCVEPSWADAQRAAPGDAAGDVHGVALKLPLLDYARLARQERGYEEAAIVVEAYDGRRIPARVFTAPAARLAPEEIPCSARYLGVLVQGAVAAGLDAAYVEALRRKPTYRPSPETLAARAALPAPAALPRVTIAELWEGYSSAAAAPQVATDGAAGTATAPRARVSVLGYVFDLDQAKVGFASHRGRDITARTVRQFRGMALDANDDQGRVPLPHLRALEPGALEYAHNWLDDYLAKEGPEAVVGFLEEFLLEQEPGGVDKAPGFDWTLEAVQACRAPGQLRHWTTQWLLNDTEAGGQNRTLASLIYQRGHCTWELAHGAVPFVPVEEGSARQESGDDGWAAQVNAYVDMFRDGTCAPPPYITTDFGGEVALAEGSPQHEAMKRLGKRRSHFCAWSHDLTCQSMRLGASRFSQCNERHPSSIHCNVATYRDGGILDNQHPKTCVRYGV